MNENETLNNSISGVMLTSGAGNDSIYISYTKVLKNTIMAGAGEDTIKIRQATT